MYDEIIINVKNHHMPATMRVDTALKNIYLMYIVFDNSIYVLEFYDGIIRYYFFNGARV